MAEPLPFGAKVKWQTCPAGVTPTHWAICDLHIRVDGGRLYILGVVMSGAGDHYAVATHWPHVAGEPWIESSACDSLEDAWTVALEFARVVAGVGFADAW